MKVKSLGHVRLLANPWTAAYQAPPSMGFSRQEYWSGVPLPSPVLYSRSLLVICFIYSESHSVVFDSLQPHGLYSPWNSPGQNTGVGSLSLLQGIFPTQISKPALPHCRWILNQLSHQGSPRILEWVAYPFSSGSLRPRYVNFNLPIHTPLIFPLVTISLVSTYMTLFLLYK